jgi:hypothetical protein
LIRSSEAYILLSNHYTLITNQGERSIAMLHVGAGLGSLDVLAMRHAGLLGRRVFSHCALVEYNFVAAQVQVLVLR